MREYLKKLREDAGMSMLEAAEKIGISKQYYGMIENGERQKKMDITLVTKLADLFHISIESIAEQEQKLGEEEPT